MPIQLDKILADIAEEKVLHPSNRDAAKKDIDDAWMRVGKNNKLSVHETRSIFKVLQKKYEQEKEKGSSAWKLFNIMDEIHTAPQPLTLKTEERDDDMLEEDEEYEMLEVQEEEEPTTTHANGSHSNNPHSRQSSFTSDGDSPLKSMQSSNSANTTPDKDERPSSKLASSNVARTPVEEKKLLNTMASATPRPAVPLNTQAQATAASLQKKGITMRKNTPGGTAAAISSTNAAGSQRQMAKSATPVRAGQGTSGFVKIVRQADSGKAESGSSGQRSMVLESGKTIQLPESIKRKLSEEQSQHQNAKRPSLAQTTRNVTQNATASTATASATVATTGTTTLVQVKQEIDEPKPESIASTTGTITITTTSNGLINGTTAGAGGTSSTAATVASTSTNGYSPRIEDLDFRNDLILDIGGRSATGAGSATGIVTTAGKIDGTIGTGDIINLGNFDNSLPPTFFKNLCISSRYEALGLYVANVMNRLSARSAAKLELGILRAIIDVQSDDLEQ